MKIKPYIQMYSSTGNILNIPIESAEISMSIKSANLVATRINGLSMIWTGFLSPGIDVLELAASSAEELWLKASAAGYIHGEDSEAPLFSEIEKENIRLREQVAATEKTLKKAKDLIAAITDVIEKQ